MANKTRKRRIVAVMLPLYLLLFIGACESSGFEVFVSCLANATSSSPGAQTAGAAAGLDFGGLTGDLVFVGNPGETIAANERRRVMSTEWGIPVLFREGEFTLSGKFDPFGGFSRDAPRPKKIDAEFVYVDAEGKTLSKDKYKLKVKGDNIGPTTKSTKSATVPAGGRMDFYIRPKKVAIDLSEPLQIFFDMPVAATRPVVPDQRWIDVAAGMARALNELFARGKELTVVTTTFGIGVEIERKELRIGGTQTREGAAAGAGRVSERAPKKVKVTWEHLDAEGEVKDDFKFTMRFANGMVSPAVNVNFPGFSVAAGESLRLKLKAAGGTFEVGDIFDLSFLLF